MRFSWRKNNELVKYEFNRLVFGINASPFLSLLISKMNAERHMESLPEAGKAILESTYMDDSLISVETEEQAVKMYKDLKWLWKQAGMDAKKWVSNS